MDQGKLTRNRGHDRKDGWRNKCRAIQTQVDKE